MTISLIHLALRSCDCKSIVLGFVSSDVLVHVLYVVWLFSAVVSQNIISGKWGNSPERKKAKQAKQKVKVAVESNNEIHDQHSIFSFLRTACFL